MAPSFDTQLIACTWSHRTRTTIDIDEELLAKASKLAGLFDRSALVRAGLVALIQRESAKRLAQLGSSQPGLRIPPRRR